VVKVKSRVITGVVRVVRGFSYKTKNIYKPPTRARMCIIIAVYLDHPDHHQLNYWNGCQLPGQGETISP
jgi:hypothetical protein